MAANDKISVGVTLLNGMPPKHLANSEKFRNYFLTEKPVTFDYNNRTFRINIKDVYIFPQAYAIAGLMKKKVAESDQILIVDIGGWTLDYMVLNNGRYNMSECESLEFGMIKFYNSVQNYCNSKFDINFNEKQIDSILNATYKLNVDAEIKEFIFKQATSYCNEIANTLKEQIEGFRAMPIVFAGGGSVTLQKYFQENPLLLNAQYVDDVRANAKGYKALYRIMK
jgi:plasmid segregation protein ParM